MLNLAETIPPHMGDKILYKSAAINKADKAMIMLHGRGASAESMVVLINEFESQNMAIIIPEATNNTWYPFRFIEPRNNNEPGISSGLTLIHSIVTSVNDIGLNTDEIYLLGFSQGACLALEYIVKHPNFFGGVFALSGGLIGDILDKSAYKSDLKKTNVFLGCSENDFHIPEKRVHESAEILEYMNASVTKRLYPEFGHSINRDEIDFINKTIL